jgi:hypothetical protein
VLASTGSLENSDLWQFVEEVRSIYDPSVPATFWNCRSSFAHLLKSEFLVDFVCAQVQRSLICDLPVLKPRHDTFGRLQLSNGLKIDILSVNPPFEEPGLQCAVENTMISFRALCAEASVSLDIFDLPPDHYNDVYDRSASLRFLERRVLSSTDLVEIDVRRQLYRLSRCTGPGAVIFLRSADALEFAWNFDDESLCQSHGISVDLVADRLCFAAQLLGEMGSKTSLESLEKMLLHASHRVRWAAIQALFAIDFDVGLRRLAIASNDQHPAVRQAATAALRRLSEN